MSQRAIDHVAAQTRLSGQTCAVGNWLVWRHQHHVVVVVMQSKGQKFTHEWPDLFGGEIDHSDDLPPDQVFGLIVLGNLRAGFALADFATKIDPELDRRATGLWKGF